MMSKSVTKKSSNKENEKKKRISHTKKTVLFSKANEKLWA